MIVTYDRQNIFLVHTTGLFKKFLKIFMYFKTITKNETDTFKSSGLYYKHILTIVSDDRKWRQYYKYNWRI